MNTEQATVRDFAGQDIFVGMDVHLKSWTVSIHTPFFEHKTFNQPPRVDVLVSYLHRFFPGARYHCVYEAGYAGFWICEALRAAGVETIVAHAADVPTTDKERTYKTNVVDARKLAQSLLDGKLKAIYVPGREALEDRNLVRLRRSLVKKITRVKNQIKAFLAFYGIELPRETRRYWSSSFVRWLRRPCIVGADPEAMRFDSGALSLRLHVEELERLREEILTVTRAIGKLSQTERYRRRVELLRTLPGIGLLSAMVILTELVDIHRFGGLDDMACFVGLIPSMKDTADKERHDRLTHRRSAPLRAVLLESAWVAARKDPQLMQAFCRLCGKMKKQEAIIRIARKQLNRIRFVLLNEVPYQVSLPKAA